MEEEARWLQVRMNVYKVIIVSHFESTKPVAASIWNGNNRHHKECPSFVCIEASMIKLYKTNLRAAPHQTHARSSSSSSFENAPELQHLSVSSSSCPTGNLQIASIAHVFRYYQSYFGAGK